MSEYFLTKQPEEPEIPPEEAPSGKRWISMKRIWIALTVFVLICVIFLAFLIQGMPDLTDLENVNPAQVTRIYSADEHKVIHELFTYNRIWIPYDYIPDYVVKAAIATEDRDFFNHWGINMKNVPRAVLVNLIHLGFRQGFSTITMQVARNLFNKKIGFKRNIFRKLREILTAIQIERTYSKEEIMEMYLNVSYFGRGAYGIQSAAKKYFNKDVTDLTPEEGALLIGLLKGPAIYSPLNHPERAEIRRNLVLHNMVVCGYLDEAAYDTLKTHPIVTEDAAGKVGIAPYFTEYVRQQLNALQDSLHVNVYEDGLQVYTTLNTHYQAAMDSAIRKHMPELQARVHKKLQDWKEENEIPDSVFAEKTEVQIAFVALDHRTGHILAMVGGRDFEKSKFNRAVQARRQPGSTFKPFLYTAAIDNGYTPVDKLLNQPVVVRNQDGTRWTPENFDHTFGGLTTLRVGLRKSLNLIAARLILEIGPEAVVKTARQMGITTPLRPFYSLAMGSFEVIPLEMVSAFGVLADQGVRVEPVSILRIEDRHGNVLYRKQPRRSQVLSPVTAYIITNMLEDVIKRGTGGRVRWFFKFFVPAAGKTGTTNDNTDAWFIGFTPYVTAGVWVGLDNPKMKLGRGETGSHAALPFWAEFMKLIYDDPELGLKPVEFRQPPGVITLDICEDSGKIATNFCPHVIKNEVFNVKYHPTATCDLHPGFEVNKKRLNTTF